MRIVDSRPLVTRLSEVAHEGIYGSAPFSDRRKLAPRFDALRRAVSRRRATLAAWDRAVASVQAAYYADWTTTTPEAIATYCAEVAILRAAGLEGPDDTAIGR